MPSTVRGIVISDVRRFPPAGGEQQEYQKYSWKQVRKNMGKIFYMMGKSSSGKDTIFKEILKKKELNLHQVVGGVWKYFTVDDEQTDLDTKDYLAIGTLVSYEKLRDYYGAERIVPIYVEVEDGMRLARALDRERSQIKPNYDEMCRRFLADSADFSEENLEKAGIKKRFQNKELQKCVEKITEFIFQSK